MSSPRKLASMDYEAGLATLALAGLRETVQATLSALPAANTAYTVAMKDTRRVMCLHLDAGANSIHYRTNAAAVVTNMPMLGQVYWVADAKLGDTLNFWNTTLGAITVFIMELA